MKDEIWTDVFGYENRYIISNYGNVKTKERESYFSYKGSFRKRILKSINRKINLDRYGYKRLFLSNLDGKKHKLIHRLVWEAFNKKQIPKNMLINHKDGVKSNCYIDNLELTNKSGNAKHAIKHKLLINAKGAQLSKYLKEKDVINIRKRLKKGEQQANLAREYNVGYNCIWHIAKRNTWKHLSNE